MVTIISNRYRICEHLQRGQNDLIIIQSPPNRVEIFQEDFTMKQRIKFRRKLRKANRDIASMAILL